MQLSFQRKRLKSIDEELPAQSRNVLLKKVQEQKLAQYGGSVLHHSVKLEVQTETQALEARGRGGRCQAQTSKLLPSKYNKQSQSNKVNSSICIYNVE